MCIKDNHPFKVVEGVDFKELMMDAEPKFVMPSRWTVAKDCLKIYKEEVVKLKKFIVNQRVSLTTDTWTSNQNINYMCLTAHWIDDDWSLQKRILYFCQIANHKGLTIGKLVNVCLDKWGIERVFTVTVDNTSSNDGAIKFLRLKLRVPEAIMNCEYMHLRCCAHIINLVVKDGLEEYNESIVRIRNAVRYVRSSPARSQKFKLVWKKKKIKCEKGLCLDVDTRWNSTYLMLESVVQYKNDFARMVYEDLQYDHYFIYDDDESIEDNTRRMKHKKKKVFGHPEEKDFDKVTCFIEFFKLFYDVTVKISGSKYVTSNLFFNELVSMQEAISKWCLSENELKQALSIKMKEKFKKYWQKLEKTNFLLYGAVLLDLRYKKSFLLFYFSRLYGKRVKNV